MIDKLLDFIEKPDLSSEIEDMSVAKNALFMYESDKASISEWLEGCENARKLCKPQKSTKTFPWPGAANINHPLLSTAVLQFASRAYPAVVETPYPVKGNVSGDDPDGSKGMLADRIGKFMSWQLLNQMTEWEEETDALLNSLPLYGTAFKKVYYCPSRARNISCFVPGATVIVEHGTKDLESCPRISEEMSFYPYEIKERQMSGEFNAEWGNKDEDYDDQEAVDCIEQQLLLDLDGDGYPEPYVITVDVESGKCLRLVANYDTDTMIVEVDGPEGKVRGRLTDFMDAPLDAVRLLSIKKTGYFVKYNFFPDPDGGFYGLGFGHMLGPLNNAVNTLLNQMIDAGTLANTGGGFLAKDTNLRSGSISLTPGEYVKVDTRGRPLRDAILPIDNIVGGPSGVLYNLLAFLLDAAKEVSSVQDVMTGGGGTNMPATTVLAQIEQGMKVFTSIYKRIHKSFKAELASLYALNAKYLDETVYFGVMDNQMAVARQDFNTANIDIAPVSDPSLATDLQRSAKAQALLQTAGMPGVNVQEILLEYYTSLKVDNPERFMMPPPQGPSPEEQMAMAEQEMKMIELQIKAKESLANIADKIASAMKKEAEVDLLEKQGANQGFENLIRAVEVITNGQGNVRGMESQPSSSPNEQSAQQELGGMGSLTGGPQGPMA